jgi:hypothetical protein
MNFENNLNEISNRFPAGISIFVGAGLSISSY